MNSPAIEYTGQIGKAVAGPMADIARRTFEGFEQLTHLNIQTVKTTLEEQKVIAEEAATSHSLEWLMSLPPAQTQASLKKALSYWRHAGNIAVDTVADNFESGLSGFNEYARWATSWLTGAVESSTRSTSVVLTDGASEAAASLNADVPVLAGSALEPTGASSSRKKKPAPIVGEDGNAISSGR
jgi:phasin family protein